MSTRALEAARASGLVERGAPLLVMLSGGADSVCLLDVAVRLGAHVSALHVNYGLRDASDGDEAHCRDLCARLGVPLAVEPVALAQAGNLQAAARDARYRLAEAATDGAYAAAHTADDQVETVLYRLASSPGRRALGGMRPRRGRLVRPLLAATRADTRAHCRAAGLAWREDASNSDPRFARTRVRHELLPALERVAPGAAANVVATSAQLAQEAELLDALADDALGRLGERPQVEALRALPPALARLSVRALAERAGARAPSADAVERILALGSAGGSAALDVGDGMRALVEYGRLRFARAHAGGPPDPTTMRVPGAATFGDFEVEAGGRDGVRLDRAAVGDTVELRAWRDGDRMRPTGLGGTRKLQDLFTDRKVPRETRRQLPLVVAGGEIAWIPGVAVGERFGARPRAPAVAFTARRVQ